MPVYENPISTYQKVTTTFDMSKMQHNGNNYNDKLVHPLHYDLEFISRNGEDKVSLAVGQLAIIAAIVAELKSPGQAIDKLLAGMDKEKISEICSKF